MLEKTHIVDALHEAGAFPAERRGEELLGAPEGLVDLEHDHEHAKAALEDVYAKAEAICDLMQIASRSGNLERDKAVWEVWGDATRLLCAIGDVKRARY